MKALFYLCICSLLLYVSSCSKGNDSTNNKTLSLIKVEKGGCFSTLKSSEKLYANDTVFFKVNADTLKMNIELGYNCCSKLADSIAVDKNIITAYVKDTCTLDCVCKCLCFFTYDFTFVNYSPQTLIYKVMLKKYNENSYSVIMQDTLNK